jgi:anti-sigma B factor antagonist
MANSMTSVGVCGGRVWVRVDGKGCFLNAGAISTFASEMLERGHRRFVVDMALCPTMDSTFMGTLAGIALKLQKSVGGDGAAELMLVQVNDRNRELLSGLGLDHLMRVESGMGDIAFEAKLEQLPSEGGGKESRARVMLEAHEACVEANGENALKFKDVLAYLREDLGKS